MNETILIFCSGGGGNLRFVNTAIREGWISRWTRIVVVASRQCPALSYAQEQGLENFVVDFDGQNLTSLTKIANDVSPDLFISTFNRILPPLLLSEIEQRFINLHYSLLPAFPGKIGVAPVRDALNYGSTLVGATVHTVTDLVDLGPPLTQIAVPVSEQDTLEIVMNLLFRAGCYALLTSLRLLEEPSLLNYVGGTVSIGRRLALISPYFDLPREMELEPLWRSLA